MTFQGIRVNDPREEIQFVNFNQDATCISVGTKEGYRIYRCDPFERCFQQNEGGIGIAEMLFSTSLVAIVGAGEQPAISPRRLRLCNTKTQSAICDLNFVSAILAVKLNRQSMQVLGTLDTRPNPQGLCVLSPNEQNNYLAFPTGSTQGEVLIYDALDLSVVNVVTAHRTAIAAMALSSGGTLLATASETGTVIRVFAVPDGTKLATLRRGSYPARIFSLAFDESSSLLAVSGSSGTIHIFALQQRAAQQHQRQHQQQQQQLAPPGTAPQGLSGGGAGGGDGQDSREAGARGSRRQADFKREKSKVGGYLPKALTDMVDSERDFAHARLTTNGVENLCALQVSQGEGGEPATGHLLVISGDGFFRQFAFDLATGGKCRLETEHVLRNSRSEEIGATYLS